MIKKSEKLVEILASNNPIKTGGYSVNKLKIRFASKKWLILLVCCVVLVAAGIIALVIVQQKSEDLESVDVIKQKVSKHMLLPGGPDPALATVTDSSKLTTVFLKQTKNGDKLLIYDKSQKVIIYRPSIDKIVDVGPVTIASSN